MLYENFSYPISAGKCVEEVPSIPQATLHLEEGHPRTILALTPQPQPALGRDCSRLIDTGWHHSLRA
eukprot:2273027-Prorocentrum_lima.AAC.1